MLRVSLTSQLLVHRLQSRILVLDLFWNSNQMTRKYLDWISFKSSSFDGQFQDCHIPVYSIYLYCDYVCYGFDTVFSGFNVRTRMFTCLLHGFFKTSRSALTYGHGFVILSSAVSTTKNFFLFYIFDIFVRFRLESQNRPAPRLGTPYTPP